MPARSWWSTLDAYSTPIVVVWLFGVCLLSARLAFGWLQVQRLRRATQPVADALTARVATLVDRLRVSGPVEVAQSAIVQVPTVVGWLRPVVLVPVSALAGLSPSQLDAILAHELAHVRRHDYAVNIIQTTIEVILFYHPACWWISRQIRHERELCCDDIAVSICGDRVAYATALTELETLRPGTPSLSVAATDGPLLRRVRRLLAAPHTASWSAPSWLTLVLPLLVSGAVAIGAQSRVPSAATIIPSTEAVIRGQVLDAASLRPVHAASIEIIDGNGRTRSTFTTGDDGRYEATGLAPGSYRVYARASGYVDAAYGGRDRNDIGVLLDAHGGQITSAIDLRLMTAGAISGRVLDEQGHAIEGAELELVPAGGVAAAEAGPAGDFAQSQAMGAYRFTQVAPGDYYVRAYVDAKRRPGADARHTYGTTFYPGVDDAHTAQPLHVGGGVELFGIDFALQVERTHHVAGRLVDVDGRPPQQVQVQMHSMDPGGRFSEFRAKVDANGRFEIPDVPRGDYMLMVIDPRMTSRWMAASRHVSVNDDVTDVELRAHLGPAIEGHVVRDVGVTRPLDPTDLRVVFQQQVPDRPGFFEGGGRPAAADGTFSFEAPAGPTTITVAGVPEGWMVRRLLVDGVEISDSAIDLGGSPHRRVDVVLTDRITHLFGIIANRDGKPVPGATVLVFPDDGTPQSWIPGSRFVQQTQAHQDGRFDIAMLPPGRYLAVAADHLPRFAFENPRLLANLAPSATRVEIGEGEQHSVSLRVVDVPSQARNAARPPAARMVIERVALQANGRRTQLSGTVRDVRGRGVAGATAMLFSASSASTSPSTAVREARTDVEGRFAFDAVKPGSYFVLATKSPEYALHDQDLLGNLSAFATAIRIAEGEQPDVSLLILPPPPPPPPARHVPALVAPAARVPSRQQDLAERQRELERMQIDLMQRQQALTRQQRDLEQRQRELVDEAQVFQQKVRQAGEPK